MGYSRQSLFSNAKAVFFATITAAILLFTGSTSSQSQVAPKLGYHVVHGWPVLPEGRVLGSVAGCAVDSHDNVFVFHRNERTWPDSGTRCPQRSVFLRLSAL